MSKLSKERAGEKNPFFGKSHSDETKQKIKDTFELIGRKTPEKDKNDIQIYYEKSNWICRMFDIVENGMIMIEQFGIFNSHKNSNGVVRDHILGRKYGYNNGIFPEILRHPANCQIIRSSENISKAHTYKNKNTILDTHISIDELFYNIKNYKLEWIEQELVLQFIKQYENGDRWER